MSILPKQSYLPTLTGFAPTLGGSSPVGPVSNVVSYESHSIDEIMKSVESVKISGYRILIVLPKLKERTAGGIIVDPLLLEKEKLAACIGYVAEVGPDAYADPRKFPNGPYCKEGDWVLFKSYSGTRIKSSQTGVELRVLNDDSVEGVITDPSQYTRI